MRVCVAFLLRVSVAVLLELTELAKPVEMPCLCCNTHSEQESTEGALVCRSRRGSRCSAESAAEERVLNKGTPQIPHGGPDLWPCVQIQEEVKVLCREVGTQAVAIVEAFGIPDHLLAAPIAADWAKFNAIDNQGELTNDAW